jgi:hypothetical protein
LSTMPRVSASPERVVGSFLHETYDVQRGKLKCESFYSA